MQIQIPESIASRLRRLAALRQEPVEVVLADRLFTSLDEELLESLDDELLSPEFEAADDFGLTPLPLDE